MDRVEITIIKDKKRQRAELFCNSAPLSITFIMEDGYQNSYIGDDFYKCFGHLRKDHPDITFLCKGAKINVHPSSMSSQMTMGVKAYELTMGKHALRGDIVNIFDYEENNLTNDPQLQQEFFMKWFDSDISE
ncbi:hypothetical protein ACSFE6_30180 [Pseudomonas baetica]|uniref:hypothetical protein n=1 Tax=Pseudomonas baetica TaxID=674054 RepID=UPI003EEB3E40